MANLYCLEDFTTYNYGYMVGDTGVLRYFDVTAYEDGIVLVLPEASHPTTVEPFRPFPKIFRVQQESENWADRLGINCVADLDDSVTEGRIGHKMLVAEALQESRISDIAQEIARRGNVKFVMIAGPSSSGKTTFSRRLSIQLGAHGMIPHPISLDDFYRDRKFCPRDENGELDYECLESLDLDLIQKTFRDLLAGREVDMPHFNFMEGRPEYRGEKLQLGANDILVIEGIHGLNMRLCENLDPDRIFRVYLSALTQLNVDEHNYISTSDGRLLRRIVRDYRTRGTNARETIERWPSVRRGEANYIFPNQENADVMFNSALIYELSILKVYAEPLLFQVPVDCPEYHEAHRLLKFLDYFLPLPSESVPINSILREFIGGSCFDV
jgi:uridine kinase